MSENSSSVLSSTRLGGRQSSGPYANKPSQLAPWHQRMRQRRMTLRKVALYAVIAAIVILSAPIAPTFIAGALVTACGIAVRLWTFGHLEKNEHMVTTGPYAHTRNPAYLGSFLVASGFILAAGNPFSFMGLSVWGMGIIALFIFFRDYLPRKYAREYPRLEMAFPQEFKRHAANVPDFFPRLTPWRSGDRRRFSLACVRANHELWWGPILSLGFVLLWLL